MAIQYPKNYSLGQAQVNAFQKPQEAKIEEIIDQVNALSAGSAFGTSASKTSISTASSGLFNIYSTSSLTSGNIVTETISQTLTAASSTNTTEMAQFILTSNVRMGNWANAVLAKVDMSATGYVTGLVGVVCAELDMPSTAPAGGAGTYTCFEAEINMASVTTVPVSAFVVNVWGNHAASFDTSGYLFDIGGLTKASGKVFQDNTATAASQALRIRINGTAYYIMLTSTGA